MILTNILATVTITLLTNVVETDNGVKGCGHEKGYLHWHSGPCTLPKEATERTVTSTVVERTEVSWPDPEPSVRNGIALGVMRTITHDRELSRTVKRYRREFTWVEVPMLVVTNYNVDWPSNQVLRIESIDTNLFLRVWRESLIPLGTNDLKGLKWMTNRTEIEP